MAGGTVPERGGGPGHPALYEAADEDSATGGPDLVRGIYPIIAVVDTAGFREIPEDEVAERFAALVARRQAERAQ